MNDYFDAWLKFDTDTDEAPECEANTRLTELGYAVDWYHNDVGQVVTVEFETLSDAYDWYELNGYSDFTA